MENFKVTNIRLGFDNRIEGLDFIHEDKNKSYRALLLAIDNNYSKKMIECLIRGVADMSRSLSLDKKEHDSSISKDDIDIEMSNFIKKISVVLEYSVNCYSWSDKSFKEFDKEEIKSKLINIIKTL